MSSQFAIAISFILFIIVFTIVGIYSSTRKTDTTTDYLVANRNVNPWLMSLSTFATGNSGNMFIGVIGFTYTSGLLSAWLLLAWYLGDYITWFFVYKRVRKLSEANQSETFSGFLSDKKNGDRSIAVLSAAITVVFLGSYAAAQLVAGSKALSAIFGWNYAIGIVLGAVVVAIYCFSGGIRASIWTDAVQSVLMLFSMLLLLVVALIKYESPIRIWERLAEIDPKLVEIIPTDLKFGFLLFLLGWLVAGIGAVGQPHIMVRAMTIDTVEHISKARGIYITVTSIFVVLSVGIGLVARVMLPDLIDAGDPQLALPQLAIDLLPPALVGIILAGLFSAVISTADSQILSCSAALTQDIFPQAAHSYKLAKLGTLSVTAIILGIALSSNNDVFGLVIFSWSALASSFGPLLIVRIFQLPLSVPVGVAMMVLGIAAALIWNIGLGLSADINETLPGMVASFLVYFGSRPFLTKNT